MKLLRGPITALRHPEIRTYFRVRSGFGGPARLVLVPLATFHTSLLDFAHAHGAPQTIEESLWPRVVMAPDEVVTTSMPLCPVQLEI